MWSKKAQWGATHPIHITPKRGALFQAALLFFCALPVTGCALFAGDDSNTSPRKSYESRKEIYYADFSTVWRAMQISLQRYPIQVNNMDKGILITEWIRAKNAWNPPHKPNQIRGGRRYQLRLRAIRGRAKGRPATQVIIKKTIEFQRDFFSGKKKQPSDGLEEKVIHYRIHREIVIDRALQKAHKQSQQGC